MAEAPKTPPLTEAQKEAVQREKDKIDDVKADRAYRKSTVYPDTEDVVTKEAPITGPIGRYATDRLFGKDVPFTERAKGAAVLVPAAAAIQAEKGIRYLGKKLSGDKEQGKKAGGPIKNMVRGGGIESRGKTKGRFV
jgi:hypothetical protein